MDFSNKLTRLAELNETIKTAYAELNPLKNEIVKEMVENGLKEIDLNEKQIITLKWAVENEIDFERLERLYPDIYILGLRPTFSVKQALNSVSKELLDKIIKDCTATTQQYKMKVGKK